MSGEGLISDRPEGLGGDVTDEPQEVVAEREACLGAFAGHRKRMRDLADRPDCDGDEPLAIDAEAFALELRRLDETFESVRLGLHRVGGMAK